MRISPQAGRATALWFTPPLRLAVVLLIVALSGVVAAEAAAPPIAGTIVYSSAGDGEDWEIYAFPAAGGAGANISRHRDSDVRPLPSPDGTRIAFARGVARLGGELLVVADADGTAQKVLPLLEPRALGWSPDSRRLLVRHWLEQEKRHDVTVVDVVSGTRTRVGTGLTAGWSPDGRMVAFIGPGNDGRGPLYVAEPGAAPQRVGAQLTGSFAWSPDGRRLASGDQALRVHDLAARSSFEIAAVPAASVVWSSDGTRVYALADRNLVSVGASGGDVRTLVHSVDRFIVSPDGHRIAAVQDVEIVLWGPAGVQKLGRAVSPAWSPDGRHLAFVRAEAGPLTVLDVSTGVVRTLDEQRPARGWLLGDVTWRPDGSAVLAARFTYSEQEDLFAVRADGSGRRRLLETGGLASESHPRWSPDGSLLAFERWICVGDPTTGCTPYTHVHIFDPGTGRVRLLARNASAPAWSPDGSQLAFATSDAGIGTVRADGRARRVVTKLGGAWPAWSRDGRTIAFAAEDGSGSILQIDMRTRASSVLVDFEEFDVTVAHLQWSPDGTRLAFTEGEDVRPWEETEEPEHVVVVNRRGKIVSRRPVPYWFGSGFSWSPDGAYMVHGGQDMLIMGKGGRSVRTLVTQDATDPSWQPRCNRTGGAAGDRLAGTARADLLCGRGGDDRIVGGRGEDRLFGGDGNDSIDARDGAFDVVGCGSGRDNVVADRTDLVGVDCERVTRGSPESKR